VYAEGTPSFENVFIKNQDMNQSQIDIRFHFYRGMVTDEQAKGTLTNFSEWKLETMDKVNFVFDEQMKQLGNVGSRSKFLWRGKNYYLQETEKGFEDFNSWGHWLCDSEGFPIKRLEYKVDPLDIDGSGQGRKFFANPNFALLKDHETGEPIYVLSAFTPSGNFIATWDTKPAVKEDKKAESKK